MRGLHPPRAAAGQGGRRQRGGAHGPACRGGQALPGRGRALPGGEAHHHRPGRGRRADRGRRAQRGGAADRPHRALQPGHPGHQGASGRAAVHPRRPAGPLQPAQHRHRRGAGADDPRPGHRAGHGGPPGGQGGGRGPGGAEPHRGHRRCAPGVRGRLHRQPDRQPRDHGQAAQDPPLHPQGLLERGLPGQDRQALHAEGRRRPHAGGLVDRPVFDGGQRDAQDQGRGAVEAGAGELPGRRQERHAPGGQRPGRPGRRGLGVGDTAADGGAPQESAGAWRRMDQ